MDVQRHFVVRGLQHRGRLPLELGDHPRGDRQPEQVAGHLLDLALAEAVAAGERGQHRLQIRAETSRWGPLRGGSAQVVMPHRGQARRWSRYSSTSGSILGNSAT